MGRSCRIVHILGATDVADASDLIMWGPSIKPKIVLITSYQITNKKYNRYKGTLGSKPTVLNF